MYCRYCGTKLKENDKFCGKCGKKQEIPKQEENIIYLEEQKIESKISNTSIIALTLCILVISLTLIICTALLIDNKDNNRLSDNIDIVNYM